MPIHYRMINTTRLISFLRELKAPSEYLITYFHGNESPTEGVCTSCEHVGTPTTQMAGRADDERALRGTLMVLAILYICNSVVLHFTAYILVR